ncbi:SGNH/GDSL hydrolase family protein [Prosthecobacter vanneervenii]|uniref:Lysophospholipase L1-like esterase n=1 Tax=Prosthecobacter vanneervenii TaxID=48466 RepID=A0A7W7Y7R5_9BACT|nr:SGNH/GDSL hydrolase family protein [Prosthecobacter vanneervenii]MBB5031198.1 lysophospholipase L1-like esterase [Prosthecobacter vanneervenii]
MRTLLLLLCVCSHLLAEAPLKTAALLAAGQDPVRIVCIGDSITGVYYHSGGRRAYPEMLQIALQQLHPQAKLSVHNAGISGDTTTGGLKRLDRDVLSRKPHLVTIMFGMNDLVGTPVDVFKKNLREMIARCRAAGAEVLLCTQNSVVETPQRPCARLAEFTQAIRDVAKDEALPVADCFAAFEAVHAADAAEWNLLLSDTIHPNMAGHKLFAETLAQAITGQTVSLRKIGPPAPVLPHVFARIKAAQPVRVLAMPPYDEIIANALKELTPGVEVSVTSWPVAGQSLAQLEASARKVRSMTQDLVIIAVPADLPLKDQAQFHHDYSWIMNWSLSFGPQQWDVVVALPSVAKPALTPEESRHEAFARRLIQAQDLSMIARRSGDHSLPFKILCDWLAHHQP